MAKRKDMEDVELGWPESKIKAINESKMPENQKQALLKEIGAIPEASEEGQIPFIVYAKMKAIADEKHKAMLSYPPASGVKKATLAEWSEIFKNF